MKDTAPTTRLVVLREPEVFRVMHQDNGFYRFLETRVSPYLLSDKLLEKRFIDADLAADEAWNEKIRQLKLDAVCSEIPESVTGEDIRLDIADWLDKRLRPIAERGRT